MKNIIMIVMALAMVVAFAPIAEAGETAQLGLEVTFKTSEPLTISAYPEGPSKIEEDKSLEFKVMDKDPDANNVRLYCKELPEGAMFVFDKTFVPSSTVSGIFSWTPKVGQSQEKPYRVVFTATSDEYIILDLNNDGVVDEREAGNANGDGKVDDTGKIMPPYVERPELVVEITVIHAEPVISIELNEAYWKLDGVKLGDKRSNFDLTNNEPIHRIVNTGNVPVVVDIGYGPWLYADKNGDGKIDDMDDNSRYIGVIHPGLEPGLNTFATAVQSTVTKDGKYGWATIPPNGRVGAARIAPNNKQSLGLVYYSPTALSKNAPSSMSATYELRAYAEVHETKENL